MIGELKAETGRWPAIGDDVIVEYEKLKHDSEQMLYRSGVPTALVTGEDKNYLYLDIKFPGLLGGRYQTYRAKN